MRFTPLLLIACCASAGEHDIRALDMRADLKFLTSPALQGRRSLHPGSEAAIEFIAAEFAKAGLEPLTGNSYLQKVPLVEYRTDFEKTRLSIQKGGARHDYRYFQDFSGGNPRAQDVRAQVVFAGYGITAPEFGYDDYAGLDARGKIVLIFDHEPQETDPKSIFNGTGNTRYANSLLKQWNAQKHGAVGVLLAAEPNRKHPSQQERASRVPGGQQRMRRLPPQALAESESNIPMFSVSDAITAELLPGPGQMQTAIDSTLKPASRPLDATAEIHVALEDRRAGESANVIGMLEGVDPQLKDETIVICAHHDHDGNWDGSIYPGADDDGSGTVGVIELARALGRGAERTKRTIVFAVFTAEERGLLGSYYYAAHPLRPLETTRAVINFDMIGRDEKPSRQTDGLMKIEGDTSNDLNLIGTINSPQYRAVVEKNNVDLRLSYKWDDDAALEIFRRSDQFPFALHNIPAVWWFTGFHPDYHQTTDTLEKLNYPKMEKIVRLAYRTVEVFANQPGWPEFVANPKR